MATHSLRAIDHRYMRTIKFRRWHTEEKDMHYDKQFYLDTDTSTYDVMQFTGLHDKNGKEIYEGDVVIWKQASGGILPPNENSYICQIKWGRVGWDCEDVEPLKNGFHSCFTFASSHIEIIGNIYSNPELLTN